MKTRHNHGNDHQYEKGESGGEREEGGESECECVCV